MWLHQNKKGFVVVMVVLEVVVSVLAKVVQAESEFHPQRKHLYIYGCKSNTTESRVLDVHTHSLGTMPGFLFGLSGTSKKVVRLLSQSSAACRLRPNKLYCVRPNTKGNQLTFVFREVVFEEGKVNQDFIKECGLTSATKGGERKRRNQEDHEHLKKKMVNQEDMMTCNFRVDELISLQSGYGFISCQGDPGIGVEQWRAWLGTVAAVEAEYASVRQNTIIGVLSGTGALLLFLIVCVACRLRSTSKTPYHSQRRPSNTSGRTHSTQDHLPSRA